MRTRYIHIYRDVMIWLYMAELPISNRFRFAFYVMNNFPFHLILMWISDLDPSRTGAPMHCIDTTNTNHEKSRWSSGQQSLYIYCYHRHCGLLFQVSIRLSIGLWSPKSKRQTKKHFVFFLWNFRPIGMIDSMISILPFRNQHVRCPFG